VAGKYRTIVADPPWDHSDGTGATLTVGMSGRPHPDKHATGLPYQTMSVEAIKALPVSDLAEKNAHLYLWATNRYLRASFGVSEDWGFVPVCVLTWCKERRGFLGGGTFPSDTEFVLFCRRGNLRAESRAPGRWYRWPRKFGAPTREGGRRSGGHSVKPEAFLDLVETVSPGPYLELFARRQRLGWDTWGDEALQHVEIVA
jgi:N6-adenosine-specific RNA methylase IME4